MRPQDDKTRSRTIRLPIPLALPAGISWDDVGEPVPVSLDVRMTAAAEHDE